MILPKKNFKNMGGNIFFGGVKRGWGLTIEVYGKMNSNSYFVIITENNYLLPLQKNFKLLLKLKFNILGEGREGHFIKKGGINAIYT